jgi:3-deoxy-D-manno-octulosonic-acid transferase
MHALRYFFALICYRLAFICLTPVMLLVLLVRSRSQRAYRQRLLERLGYLPRALKTGGVIVHASSVGEVLALKSTIALLLEKQEFLPVTVTCFTPTGSAQIIKLFGNKVQHCYLPLDNIFSTKLFINRLKPQSMVFMETELWPEIIAQCHHQQIKLMLINARLSAKSVRQYQKIAWLITPTLNHFEQILTQSHENHKNFISLGRQEKGCEVSGNLKFDIRINDQLREKQDTFKQILPQNRPIWIIASTHPGDEVLVLSALAQLKLIVPELLLIIAPRHPERFDEVASLCQAQHFKLVRRSSQQEVNNSTDIFLLDSIGELLATFNFATLVTMGGSFSDVGGHNPLEPALFRKPIIVGEKMHNFNEIMAQLQENKAIVQITTSGDDNRALAKTLGDQVLTIINSTDLQQTLGNNAFAVVMSNQGASVRTVETLMALLTEKVD